MDSILVLGGAGYIGSHCCKVLRGAGYLPVVFDNFSTGYRDFVRWGPLVEGDIRDEAAIDAAIRAHRPVAAMHFAARSLVGESMADPGAYYDNNVTGTLSLLNALGRNGVDKLVFSSTCAVYTDTLSEPITEDAAIAPASTYGATKMVCERMMADFRAAHGLNAMPLRYFNAAGADPEAETGEAHVPESHLIPLVLDAALGRREAISVFGDDYPTADGTAVRDYVHVMDIARAHVAALEYLRSGGEGEPVNLGTGTGHSVLEVIEAAEAVTGRRIERRIAGRRAGDPASLVAAGGKARAVLGWRAERPDLETIIADAWRWHSARFGENGDRS